MTAPVMMKGFLKNLLRFWKAERGMTLPLLGLSILMLMGFVGVAIDFGRLQLAQSKLSASVDAAGLALGTNISKFTTDTARAAEVQKYLNVNFPSGYLGMETPIVSVSYDVSTKVLSMSALSTMPTTFMSIFGVSSTSAQVSSQITLSTGGLELALVLDTTGSMAEVDHTNGYVSVTKLQALQAATATLLTSLYGDKNAAEKLWIGVVPFSQAVNLGLTSTSYNASTGLYSSVSAHSDWLSTTATRNTDTSVWTTSAWQGCVEAEAPPDTSAAHAYDRLDLPPSTTGQKLMMYYYTSMVGDTYKYAATCDSTWCPAGCTQTYCTPSCSCKKWVKDGWTTMNLYDSTATGRSTSVVDTTAHCRTYCENTAYNVLGTGWAYNTLATCAESSRCADGLYTSSPNIYTATGTYSCGSGKSSCQTGYYYSSDKTCYAYRCLVASHPVANNRNCPTSLLMMTGTKQVVQNLVNSLSAAGNTYINVGLAWGWRLLSPNWRGLWGGRMNDAELPLAYGTPGMSKAMILLSDGDNSYDSTYSAYGSSPTSTSAFSAGTGGRLSTIAYAETTYSANSKLDRKTSLICESIKAAGIKIYVVALGDSLSSNSETILKNCSSGADAYYFKSTDGNLNTVFQQIGDSLSNLRISK